MGGVHALERGGHYVKNVRSTRSYRATLNNELAMAQEPQGTQKNSTLGPAPDMLATFAKFIRAATLPTKKICLQHVQLHLIPLRR